MPANGSAEWKGDVPTGTGTFTAGDTISGGYTYKSRFEDGPGSNPEQLIAAAHAACFSMALANILAQAGSPPNQLHTDASVTLRLVDGNPTITKIALVTVGRVPGVDEATFIEHAQTAKAGCPVSRALAGVPEITLEASAGPMTEAFVLGGVRTPFGRYGGSLSHLRTDDLLGQTMVAACEHVGVPLERIEDITAGCVNTAHEGMGDIARWGALAAGFPDSVPAVTVNRFCASSLTGAINIAHAIRADELEVGLAAGVESMSRSGWAQMKGDAPFSPRGPVLLLDTMWAGAGGPPNPGLLARNAYVEMIKTAQNVADRYGLTREEIDAFALRSHHRAAAARDSGRLALEIHPVEIPGNEAPACAGPSSTTRASGATRRPSSWPLCRRSRTRPR